MKMKNPFRYRWAIEGHNPSTGETTIIRRYRFDRRAAEIRVDLLNGFAEVLGLRTRSRVIKIG